jgi:hypothetical protein
MIEVLSISKEEDFMKIEDSNTIMFKAYLHTYRQASIFQISNSSEERAC